MLMRLAAVEVVRKASMKKLFLLLILLLCFSQFTYAELSQDPLRKSSEVFSYYSYYGNFKAESDAGVVYSNSIFENYVIGGSNDPSKLYVYDLTNNRLATNLDIGADLKDFFGKLTNPLISERVFIKDNYALVFLSGGYLVVYDISLLPEIKRVKIKSLDESLIKEIDSAITPFYLSTNNFLLLMGKQKFTLYDISDVYNITVKEVTRTDNYINYFFGIEYRNDYRTSFVYDLSKDKVKGDFVYLFASKWLNEPEYPKELDYSLTVLSLKDLTFKGSYEIGIVDQKPSIEIEGDLAYITADSSIIILNIADLDNIKEVARYDTGGSKYTAFKVSNNYGYLLDRNTGGTFVILDLSDLSNIKELGSYNLTSISGGFDISKNYAFIEEEIDTGFGQKGDYQTNKFDIFLHVVDISNPEKLKLFDKVKLRPGETYGGYYQKVHKILSADVTVFQNYVNIAGYFYNVGEGGHQPSPPSNQIRYDLYKLLGVKGLVDVEILSFDGEVKKNKVVLTWKTSAENGIKGFYIERENNSANGKVRLKKNISSKGTDSKGASYKFIDKQIKKGKTYIQAFL